MAEKATPFGVKLKPTGRSLTLDKGVKPQSATKQNTFLPTGPTRVAALKTVFGDASDKSKSTDTARWERKLSPRTGNGALKTSGTSQGQSGYSTVIKKTEENTSSQFKAFGLTFAKISTSKEKPKSETNNVSVGTGATREITKTSPRDGNVHAQGNGQLIQLDKSKVEQFISKSDKNDKSWRSVPFIVPSNVEKTTEIKTSKKQKAAVVRKTQTTEVKSNNKQTTEVKSKSQTSGIIRQEKSVKSEFSLDLTSLHENDNSRSKKLEKEQRTKSFPESKSEKISTSSPKFSHKTSKNSKKGDVKTSDKNVTNEKNLKDGDMKSKVSPHGAFVTRLIEKCETRDIIQDSHFGKDGVNKFSDTLLDKLAILEGLVSESSSDEDSDDSNADDGYHDVATVIECLAEEGIIDITKETGAFHWLQHGRQHEASACCHVDEDGDWPDHCSQSDFADCDYDDVGLPSEEVRDNFTADSDGETADRTHRSVYGLSRNVARTYDWVEPMAFDSMVHEGSREGSYELATPVDWSMESSTGGDKAQKRFVIKDGKSTKNGRLERRLAKRRSADVSISKDKLNKRSDDAEVPVPDWDTSSGRASMAEEESLEDSDNTVTIRPHTIIELTDEQAKRLKQRNHNDGGKPAGTKWKKKWKQFYRRSQNLLDIPGLQSKLENMSLTQLPANVKQKLRDRMKRAKKKRMGQFVVNPTDEDGDQTDEMCRSSSEDLRSEVEETEDSEGIYHTIDTLPRTVTPVVSVNIRVTASPTHEECSPPRDKLPISPAASVDYYDGRGRDDIPDLPSRSHTGSAYERYSLLDPKSSRENEDGMPSLPPKTANLNEYNLLNKRNLNTKRTSLPVISNRLAMSNGGVDDAPPLPPRNIKAGRMSLGNLDVSVPAPSACTAGAAGDSYLRQPKLADKFPVETVSANRNIKLLGQVPPPPQKHRPDVSGSQQPPVCGGPSGLGYLDMDQAGEKDSPSLHKAGGEMLAPAPFSDIMDFEPHSSIERRHELDEVEIDLELQVSVSRSRYKSRFEREPLYQYYNKDYINRQSWQRALSEDPSSPKSDDSHEYIDPEISITISTEKPLSSLLSLAKHSSKPDQPTAPLIAPLGQNGTMQRTLWSHMPEVQKSGILETLTDQEKKEQEAMFEIITSEASYFKSLNVLINNFVTSTDLSDVISKQNKHQLFSNIGAIRDTSEKFLADLEAKWNESEGKLISDISDIITKHANDNFDPYVKYCANKTYQDRIYDHLIKTNPSFKEVVMVLQGNAEVQGLPMVSFFLLPMQRITRLPLLMDSVARRREPNSDKYCLANQALNAINKLVKKCNEGAKRMEQTEQLCMIEKQLDFKIKKVALVSSSRYMVKEGELVRIATDSSSKLPFGKNRPTKHSIHLFLFNDLLLVAKKKGENQYSVVDYSKRNSVHVEAILNIESCPLLPNGVPSGCKNVFLMAMLENHEGKQVELILSCSSPSDRTRWLEAFTPKMVDTDNEKVYEEWDCPQVQAIHPYNATQPDELSLEEADVVNVFRKMADGWYEGERIRDGERGWFPELYIAEILSSHVRARNLRLRYRVLVASKELAQKKS